MLPAGEVASEIDAGQAHTCVVTTDANLYCWGANDAGQLTTAAANSAEPVRVDQANELHGWNHVSAGGRTTCATNDGGEAYCWGSNDFGQLGIGDPRPESRMPALVGLVDVQQISVGTQHACAVTQDTLRCWGGNANGQVGVSSSSELSPVTPDGPAGTPAWSDAEAGGVMSCAIQNGRVFCWGDDRGAALGDDDCCRSELGPVAARPVATPVDLVPLVNAFEISLGAEFGCALFGDAVQGGVARCWGDNSFGQLANTRTSYIDQATPILQAGPWSAVRLGSNHGCAVNQDGSVWCWGDNSAGQVDPSLEARVISTPVQVAAVGPAVDVALGRHHTCALLAGTPLDEQRVRCWGANDGGQLGGLGGPSVVAPLLTADDWIAIVAGKDTTCVIAANPAGNQCWGAQPVWMAEPLSTPRLLNADDQLFDVVRLGDDSACYVDDGFLLCSGVDTNGMRGDGGTVPGLQGFTVVVISDMQPLTSIVEHTDAGAEGTHRCAVDASGETRCWGNNNLHQVRPESIVAIDAAVDIIQPADNSLFKTDVSVTDPAARRIVAGKDFTCAIQQGDQRVFCWGNNAAMQLTRNGPSLKTGPDGVLREIAVGTTTNKFRTIAAGLAFACGIHDGGDLYCWGNSRLGEVGTGDSDQDHLVEVHTRDQ